MGQLIGQPEVYYLYIPFHSYFMSYLHKVHLTTAADRFNYKID